MPDGTAVAGPSVCVITQLVCVPLIDSDCSEFAAKPVPVTVTCAPGLTAASVPSFGCTVNVAVAYAPLWPVTVMVCVPATTPVGTTKPEHRSMPPFLLITVKPVAVVAVIVVESNFTVIGSFALNPEPVMAIVNGLVTEPSVPLVGVTWTVADATVKSFVTVLSGKLLAESDTDRV